MSYFLTEELLCVFLLKRSVINFGSIFEECGEKIVESFSLGNQEKLHASTLKVIRMQANPVADAFSQPIAL